jgi:hypothetical protein
MIRYVVNSLPWILLCLAAPADGAPIIYLSSDPIGVATPPDPSDSLLVQAGASGILNLFVMPDVRMDEVRFHVANMGSAIELTDLDVLNPNNRWALIGGPQVIQPQEIRNIGGAAVPGVFGNGIGPGSPDPGFDSTSGYLIATLNFLATANRGATSELFIKAERAVSWDGNLLDVHLGGPNHPLTPGNVINATDCLLDFRIQVVPEPCSAALALVGLLCWPRFVFRGGGERRRIARNSNDFRCP